jgi:hypothetical protein
MQQRLAGLTAVLGTWERRFTAEIIFASTSRILRVGSKLGKVFWEERRAWVKTQPKESDWWIW